MARGVSELVRLSQPFRVEHAAPWGIGPAADAGADAAVDAGPDAATDGGTDAGLDSGIDCTQAECTFVCPDYGMGECYPTDPVEIYQACCCDEVCCECEYGTPVPPEQWALCCEPFNGDDYGLPPP